MNDRMAALLVERERLLMRCDLQRERLVELTAVCQRPLRLADRVLGIVKYFRDRPLLVGVGVALIFALRARTTLGLIRKGYTFWRTLRVFDWFKRFR